MRAIFLEIFCRKVCADVVLQSVPVKNPETHWVRCIWCWFSSGIMPFGRLLTEGIDTGGARWRSNGLDWVRRLNSCPGLERSRRLNNGLAWRWVDRWASRSLLGGLRHHNRWQCNSFDRIRDDGVGLADLRLYGQTLG